MITPKEYAESVQAKYQTVMLWLRQGLIPGATREMLPTGGHYYLVPSDAPRPETQRGPKPKKVTDGQAEESLAIEAPATKPARKAGKKASKK